MIQAFQSAQSSLFAVRPRTTDAGGEDPVFERPTRREFSVAAVRVLAAGQGRRQLHYLYYRVVNRPGKPREFVPEFTLVTETGKRYEEAVLPMAVPLIKGREEPSIRVLGAVEIDGVIPPSTKQAID